MSDPVLIRADGSYLYTLPSVVDDIEMGITHIVRGEDHVSNTGVRIRDFRGVGGEGAGFRPSQSAVGQGRAGPFQQLGSLSLSQLREDALAVAIVATLTGTALPVEPLGSLDELAQKLDFSAVSHGPAPVSIRRSLMNSMPGCCTRWSSPPPDRASQRFGLDDEPLWLALRPNLALFGDIADLAGLIKGPVEPVIDPEDADFLAEAAKLLPDPLTEDSWGEWTNALKAATGRKGRALFHPLRLTGREQGPELRTLDVRRLDRLAARSGPRTSRIVVSVDGIATTRFGFARLARARAGQGHVHGVHRHGNLGGAGPRVGRVGQREFRILERDHGPSVAVAALVHLDQSVIDFGLARAALVELLAVAKRIGHGRIGRPVHAHHLLGIFAGVAVIIKLDLLARTLRLADRQILIKLRHGSKKLTGQ